MPTIVKSFGPFHDKSHSYTRKVGGYVGPATYVTGGDPFAAGDLGLGRIELMLFTPASNGTLFIYPVWVPAGTGGAVKWLIGATGVEVSGGANLSGYTARFEAIGV